MIAVIVLVLIDRISKLWILESNVNMCIVPGLLNFTCVKNTGMVFGIAQGSNMFMGMISLIICIAIIGYLINVKRRSESYCYGWCLILAGGIGNMIDRFSFGYVVDFIDTPWIATFNLADVFIVFGILTLLLELLLNTGKGRSNSRIGDRYW